MKIYFAGSIRGGREDQALYLKLITYLKEFGEVLTEHVGSGTVFEDEKDQTDKEIYDQDMAWLQDADCVVAEVTQPSIGVGYEIGVAEQLGKPVLCLYRNEHASAMLQGDCVLKKYSEIEEGKEIIMEFLNELEH